MKLKSPTFIALFGLWTALTFGGSIWRFIIMRGPNSVTRLHLIPLDNTILHLIVSLAVFLCGGGLWGLGIARLMNADIKSMVIACALTWTGTVFSFLIVVLLLGSYFGGFSQINFLPIFSTIVTIIFYWYLSLLLA